MNNDIKISEYIFNYIRANIDDQMVEDLGEDVNWDEEYLREEIDDMEKRMRIGVVQESLDCNQMDSYLNAVGRKHTRGYRNVRIDGDVIVGEYNDSCHCHPHYVTEDICTFAEYYEWLKAW